MSDENWPQLQRSFRRRMVGASLATLLIALIILWTSIESTSPARALGFLSGISFLGLALVPLLIIRKLRASGSEGPRGPDQSNSIDPRMGDKSGHNQADREQDPARRLGWQLFAGVAAFLSLLMLVAVVYYVGAGDIRASAYFGALLVGTLFAAWSGWRRAR